MRMPLTLHDDCFSYYCVLCMCMHLLSYKSQGWQIPKHRSLNPGWSRWCSIRLGRVAHYAARAQQEAIGQHSHESFMVTLEVDIR